MKKAKLKESIIYMHPERGYYDRDAGKIYLNSANLIDFFVEVFRKLSSSVLIIPESTMKGEVIIKLGENTQVFNVRYPQVREKKYRQILSTIKFAKQLTRKKVLEQIRSSKYSVSGSLDFYSTVFGFVRTFIVKKNHRFIIRGNRFKTVLRSSRTFFSKNFALLRIMLYERFIVYLLNSGRAEFWFQGQESYERYRGRCGNDAKRRLFLLNAVLREFTNESEYVDSKKKYDLVFVGGIRKEKGIFDLIEAISILSKESLKPTALIIGEGIDKFQAMRLAKQFDVKDQVTFFGYVASSEDLASLIIQAKLFVLPSYAEGLPRAMVESMFLGVPVLVTPVGGIKYVIQNETNGFLVEPRSPELLAGKIKHILNLLDRSGAKFLIEAARAEAKKYSFPSRAQYFLKHSIDR